MVVGCRRDRRNVLHDLDIDLLGSLLLHNRVRRSVSGQQLSPVRRAQTTVPLFLAPFS